MSRHSKNNTANSVFTYGERQKLKEYGTLKQRVGQDSQKDFDKCSLCLQRLINPRCCNKGHVFCNDCIIENLVNQKKQNEELIREWEHQQKIIESRKNDEEIKVNQKKLEMFEKAEFDLNIKIKGVDNPFTRPDIEETKNEMIKAQLQSKGRIDDKDGMIKKNFWVPETKTGLDNFMNSKPQNKLLCPASKNHEVKLKQLYKMNLDYDSDKAICALCKKELKFQKIAMPSVCGHVFCKKCLELSIDKQPKCPVCLKKFTINDIISLQEAWSAFTAHNPVEAQKYTPSFSG